MSPALVIPCYNEAERLSVAQVEQVLGDESGVRLLLLDDGSTDATADLIRAVVAKNPHAEGLYLPRNRGKAEAVRIGLLQLLEEGHDWVGFADADFATPASELLRLVRIACERDVHVLMGSRVRLLGTYIERRARRHYLGRVFATFASLTLGLPVYDTQCGAKLFRRSNALRDSLRAPFLSRWVFDVELLARLMRALPDREARTFLEVPLLEWRDVRGSKLGPSGMLRAAFDLSRIAIRLRRA